MGVEEDTNVSAIFGTAKFGAGTFTSTKRREKKGVLRKTGNWATVRVTHDALGRDFRLFRIQLGTIPLGSR